MNTFEPPTRVAAHLDRSPILWMIAGGWALDLFIGRETRTHADVDVAVLRREQRRLRSLLPDWRWSKVIHRPGHFEVTPWGDEWLELPVHELVAEGPLGEHLEFLLQESTAEEWLFRRDSRIRCPLRDIATTSRVSLPILCPEIALLYKAKEPREKDEADYRAVLPFLAPSQRVWLVAALAHCYPGHPWLLTAPEES